MMPSDQMSTGALWPELILGKGSGAAYLSESQKVFNKAVSVTTLDVPKSVMITLKNVSVLIILYVEVAKAVECLAPSTDVFILAKDIGIDYVPKGAVGHNDRGLWRLPKFKHLYHIRLCGN